ncbi:hypothetical protein HYV79_04305 [Candidatus Woesearchaeota archaeon]|nr:hypothetical protein [Candidatus Woesearchaeota archaeon]
MEQKVIVTFETLYELSRREKLTSDLQKIDPEIFDQIKNYLKEKQELYNSCSRKTDLFSQKEKEDIAVQLVNIRRVLKEWYDRREQKIATLAINKSRTNSAIIDTCNLVEQEKKLYQQLTHLLGEHREKYTAHLLELPKQEPVMPEQTKKESDRIKVRFVEPVDAFFGTELEEYGPFKENEEAELPNPLADILISDGKAEHTQINPQS